MTKRPKIAIFAGYFAPHMGGVERYTEKLSGALAKLGYEVIVVTSNDSDQPPFEKHDLYSLYRLPILKLGRGRYPIPKLGLEYQAQVEQIESEGIDVFIVNTRFHLTSLVGAKMGKRLGKPVLLIEHGTNHLSVGNRLLDAVGALYEHGLTQYLRPFVDRFYGVSASCNEWLEHFGIRASGVFYNAVDPYDAQDVKDLYAKKYPAGEIVVTYAGRLIKEKGVLNLVEAFRQVKAGEERSKLRLVIAGSGELLESLRAEHKGKTIDILGKLDPPAVMSLLKRTDIFVHPSLYPEGLPTSILEAGLMGCAIIATPKGGTTEVIRDREHGRIVDGSVSSLREAISELATDPAARSSCGIKAQQRIKAHFVWDSVAKQVDNQIKGLSVG